MMKRPIEVVVITAAMQAEAAERARHTVVPEGSPMDCAPNPYCPLDPATREFHAGIDCALLDAGMGR